MSETKCITCGCAIQEVTAKYNGGKCMICIKGVICGRCGARTLSKSVIENLCQSCYLKDNPPPLTRSTFDLNLMLKHSLTAINEFAEEHKGEVFYAFSIDAQMLCLNSEEAFSRTLINHQQKYPQYTDPTTIQELKMNTGDWKYQGFCDLDDEHGFSSDRYDAHYNMESEKKRQNSSYWKTMNKLLQTLTEQRAFDALRRTKDFVSFVSDHNY